MAKIYNFQINNENFSVKIISENEEYFTVDVNGEIIEVRKDEKKNEIPFKKNIEQINSSDLSNNTNQSMPERKSQKNNSGQIKALMPGKILKILVNRGDSVSIGTPLIVLESMKMENTISSDKNGKVIDVHIKVDDSVHYDELMIEIN